MTSGVAVGLKGTLQNNMLVLRHIENSLCLPDNETIQFTYIDKFSGI